MPVRLEFDNEQMRELMGETILASINGEQRDEILKQALVQIVTPTRDYRGISQGDSPLQQAFTNATQRVAQEIAKELIEESPELRQKLKDAVREGVEKIITEGRLSSAIYQVIWKALEDH